MNSTTKYLLDVVERAARTFVQAYLACWLAVEPGYDTLFTTMNLKAGVVGVAMSVAMSVGARSVGSANTASMLPAGPDTDRG